MRDNTSDSAEIRWEILKSMLDSFPQLVDRTEKYIIEKRNTAPASKANHLGLDLRELMRKAVNEYRTERIEMEM